MAGVMRQKCGETRRYSGRSHLSEVTSLRTLPVSEEAAV